MGVVGRMLRHEGIIAGSLRLMVSRGMLQMGATHPTRKQELHVSDFTMSDDQWCARTLVRRWIRGDVWARRPSAVQLDGKWREDKWYRIFEAAGILRDYQAEWYVGPLAAHPDFILNWGFGNRIIELTGHDATIDFRLLAQRVAVKRRQNLMYQVMAWYLKKDIRLGGFVIVENKGTNTYKIHPVPWDPKKAAVLCRRVHQTLNLLRRLKAAKTLRARRRIWRSVSRCRKKRCDACDLA